VVAPGGILTLQTIVGERDGHHREIYRPFNPGGSVGAGWPEHYCDGLRPCCHLLLECFGDRVVWTVPGVASVGWARAIVDARLRNAGFLSVALAGATIN
jgi:hypothetical protein